MIKEQKIANELVTNVDELITILNLPHNMKQVMQAATKLFPLRIPRKLLLCLPKGSVDHPILRQYLPDIRETTHYDGFTTDPLQEQNANPVPGVLHKYHGRVLITLTQACAVHCRYCFRRHFPYQANNPGKKGWENIFTYIKADTNINEVILSGGDPLMLPDTLLSQFVEKLATVTHVHILRFHTKLPVVLPSRITPSFLTWLHSLANRFHLVMVIHCNHPDEITADVQSVLLSLKKGRIHLLNQSVLLKDVNDDANILIKLSQALFALGVMPYYLHLLDKVAGTAHYDIPFEDALNIHQAMSKRLPGYLVPKLVREIPHAGSKTTVL